MNGGGRSDAEGERIESAGQTSGGADAGSETERPGQILSGIWGRLLSPSALSVSSPVLSTEWFLVPTIYDFQFQSSHEKEQDL